MQYIRLTRDVPVAREHGMTKGRLFRTIKKPGERGLWVLGDAGEQVRLMPHEYEYCDQPGEGRQCV